MNNEDFEKFVGSTDTQKHGPVELQFYLDGMNEENGEISGVFKRMRRGDYGQDIRKYMLDVDEKLLNVILANPKIRLDIIKEIGDREWYTTRFLQNINSKWSEVYKVNKNKLDKRLEKNMIVGKGDERENT